MSMGFSTVAMPMARGFPGGSVCKESSCNAGDLDLSLGWEDLMIYISCIFWIIVSSNILYHCSIV